MLKGIEVRLSVDYFDIKNQIDADKIIYTGMIDRFLIINSVFLSTVQSDLRLKSLIWRIIREMQLSIILLRMYLIRG